MIVAEYKFFRVVQQFQLRGRKTRDYDIVAKRGGTIGEIRYYPTWRQHVLMPYLDTVWSAGCLADVNDFLAKLKVSEATR